MAWPRIRSAFLSGRPDEVAKEEIATTMLMAPHYEGDIEAFYALYVGLTDLLESGDAQVVGGDP